MIDRRARVWLVAVTLLALLPAPAAAQAPPAGVEQAGSAEVAAAITVLDAWIAAQVERRELPGLAVGIVHDQRLLWAKGYGWADADRRVPVTPATAFRVGSISKLFTATAILQLRDAGKLRLDDPVAAHLPWFQVKLADPDAPPITIRHLLTHTAGLPREAGTPYWTDGRFPEREDRKSVG